MDSLPILSPVASRQRPGADRHGAVEADRERAPRSGGGGRENGGRGGGKGGTGPYTRSESAGRCDSRHTCRLLEGGALCKVAE